MNEKPALMARAPWRHCRGAHVVRVQNSLLTTRVDRG
jgi:hypothetical protein